MEFLPDDLALAYLDRLECDLRPGGVDPDALFALQSAHVARVPYETLDIVRGRAPGIDPLESVKRVLAGRGGATATTSTAPSRRSSPGSTSTSRVTSPVCRDGSRSRPAPTRTTSG